MASLITRFIRPIGAATKMQNQFLAVGKRLSPIHQQTIIRPMASATNYHYHEKPAEHSHDKLWKAERYLSLGLLGVLPAAAVISNPIMDYAVALSLVIHVHWGVEAIVTDYVRPSIFGTTIPKVSIALVYILSSLALGGLFMFNYTDIGITQASRMLAKL